MYGFCGKPVQMELDPTRRLFDRPPWVAQSKPFDKSNPYSAYSSEIISPGVSIGGIRIRL